LVCQKRKQTRIGYFLCVPSFPPFEIVLFTVLYRFEHVSTLFGSSSEPRHNIISNTCVTCPLCTGLLFSLLQRCNGFKVHRSDTRFASQILFAFAWTDTRTY
uniref:Uncharacterized protein n=1 Tax=Anopheles coluzzii TaxID=1518534 RepID=A0A8W7P717_ANOCL